MSDIKMGANGIPYTEITNDSELSYSQLISNSQSYGLIGEFDKALECANKAIQLKPDEIDGYGFRGIAFIQKGDKQSAVEAIDKTIKLLQNAMRIVLNCKEDNDVLRIKEFDPTKFLKSNDEFDSYDAFRSMAMKGISKEIGHYEKLLNSLK